MLEISQLRTMVLRAIAFKALDKAAPYSGIEKMDEEILVSEHLSLDCAGLKTSSLPFGVACGFPKFVGREDSEMT